MQEAEGETFVSCAFLGAEVLSKRHFMLSPCKSRMRDELYWGEAL